MKSISLQGIFARFVIALALVCLTWNPTRYNYYDWAVAQWDGMRPIVVSVGVVLLVAWIIFVRATTRSLGMLGIILAVGLGGCVLWILLFYGFVERTETTLLSWFGLVVLAAVLAVGMSWSHLRRRWTGQLDVDDVDQR